MEVMAAVVVMKTAMVVVKLRQKRACAKEQGGSGWRCPRRDTEGGVDGGRLGKRNCGEDSGLVEKTWEVNGGEGHEPRDARERPAHELLWSLLGPYVLDDTARAQHRPGESTFAPRPTPHAPPCATDAH